MSSNINYDFDGLFTKLLKDKFLSPEETEIQRVDLLIMGHRDEVIQFLKEKYPEEFI